MGSAENAAAPLAGNRGQVDDAAVVLLLHHLADRLGQQEEAEHIYTEDLLHVSQSHIGDSDLLRDTGVVDQYVNPAMEIHHGVDQAGDSSLIAEVGGVACGLITRGLEFLNVGVHALLVMSQITPFAPSWAKD